MSQLTHKHDSRLQYDSDEMTTMAYGHFNHGVGHDIPVGGGRRRVTTTPPGLRATLETSREIKFVKQGAVRDPMHSSASCLLESTAAAAAATNFTPACTSIILHC